MAGGTRGQIRTFRRIIPRSDLRGKESCKRQLLREMGLPEAAMERPLLGIVSRFTSQKGFDLIGEAAPKLFEGDVYLVALGNGEAQWEELFRSLQAEFPERIAVKFGYDEPLAHRIEAGADIFLMPSRYEPCGLNQLYSLRYGTIPVVRATGGLDDTIVGYPAVDATSFKFDEVTMGRRFSTRFGRLAGCGRAGKKHGRG